MGLPAQSEIAAEGRRLRLGRQGLALPTAMFTLVTISVLLAGLYTFSDLSVKAVRNRQRADLAVHVAEAGVAHALGLLRGSLKTRSFTRILRGSDDLIATPPQRADDSLFINWGLAAGNQIPLAGQAYQGHTYFVTYRDDPADGDADAKTDLNGRIVVRCRAVTADGSTAEVEAIIGSVPMPGFAADGNISISGTPSVLGPCGGIHANGNLSAAGGGPTIGTQATATGTVGGSYTHPDGTPAGELELQDPIVIPTLNPMNYCTGAEFNMRIIAGVPKRVDAAGVETAMPVDGWSYNAGTLTWSLNGAAAVPTEGTYCVQGNLLVSGSTGTAAAPRPVTFLATGSIRIEGTPYLRAEHDDGILAMAAGDIYLAGNPAAGALSYSGMIYAGAQCSAQGLATMFGQLLCKNGAQPAGAVDWAPGNTSTLAGNFTLNFDCSGNVFNKRRVLYWYPRIGT